MAFSLPQHFTNLVKIKIWQYNRRAKQIGDCLIWLDRKWKVRIIADGAPLPREAYDYLAVVVDYGDHHKIRFTTRAKYPKGAYLKSFLYRK